MASIETRKNRTGQVTSYRVVWRQHGTRQSEAFAPDNQRDAERFQLAVKHAGERWPDDWVRGFGPRDAIVPEADRLTSAAKPTAPTLLAEAVAFTTSKHTKAGPEHRMKMRRDFERHLAGELGDTPIDEVTRAQIQEWLDDQAERYTFKTIKTRRATLSAVFRVWVYEHGGNNPVEGTRNDGTTESKVEPVFLAAWEVDAIVEQLANDPHHGGVYVETLVGTGMRKGEALALRVGDLDLGAEHPAIRISKARKHGHDGVHRIGTTKTRSSRRTVTIDPDLAALLRGFVAGRAPSETLFDLGNEGTWQRNRWVPALRAARLADNPRIHDLRHTHASWLLADGMPLFAVSKRLGHSDIQTTANIYGHLDRSTDIAAAASISRVRRPEARPPLRAV
jgi:integrase